MYQHIHWCLHTSLLKSMLICTGHIFLPQQFFWICRTWFSAWTRKLSTGRLFCWWSTFINSLWSGSIWMSLSSDHIIPSVATQNIQTYQWQHHRLYHARMHVRKHACMHACTHTQPFYDIRWSWFIDSLDLGCFLSWQITFSTLTPLISSSCSIGPTWQRSSSILIHFSKNSKSDSGTPCAITLVFLPWISLRHSVNFYFNIINVAFHLIH